MALDHPIMTIKPCRRSFWREYGLAIFLSLLMGGLTNIGFPITDIALYTVAGLIVIFILAPEIGRMRNVYKVTANQLIVEKGILRKQTRSVFMDNIVDVELHQNVIQRILGFGSLHLVTRSGFKGMELEGIRKPKKFRNKIESLVRTATRRIVH